MQFVQKTKMRKAVALYKCLLLPDAVDFINYVIDNPGCSQQQAKDYLDIEQSYFSTRFGPLSRFGIITITRKGRWLEYDVDLDKLQKAITIAKNLSNYKPVDKYARTDQTSSN